MAGLKKKYKDGIKTVVIHPLIPKEKKQEILTAIDKIVQNYKND